MPRIFKYIAYLILFVVSFFLFLYWMFPYEILKDRVATAIEEPFGREIEVVIGGVKPYYFTGLVISDLKLVNRVNGEAKSIAEFQKVKARASFFSLLFGGTKFSFLIQSGKGEIEGYAKQTEEGFDIDADLDDFDIGSIKYLESDLGIKLAGKVSGTVELKIDRARTMRTSGKVDLSLSDFQLAASELKAGGTSVPLPEAVITKGKGSKVKLTIDKGAVNIDEFRLAEGDINADIKGKIFMSTTVPNYRLNLSGTFKVADKLTDAIPLLFMVEKQRQQDGTYPVIITGRFLEPSIKIGTFTLPL